jgi:hypothetical protein
MLRGLERHPRFDMITRRTFLGQLAGRAALAVTASALPAFAESAPPTVTVYKTPTCGCCGKWLDHLRANGFTVVAHDVPDTGVIRARYAVPNAMASCHTALVGNYVVEGHVPADLIQRLLRERPKIAGLAVPGMVVGSPGMEGGKPRRYDVVAFTRDGQTRVYATRN